MNSQKTNTHRDNQAARPNPLRGNSSTLPGRISHVNPQFPNFFGVQRSLVGSSRNARLARGRKPARLDTGFGYLTRSDSRAQAPHRPDVPTNPEPNLISFVSVLSVPVRHAEHYVIALQGSKSGGGDGRPSGDRCRAGRRQHRSRIRPRVAGAGQAPQRGQRAVGFRQLVATLRAERQVVGIFVRAVATGTHRGG